MASRFDRETVELMVMSGVASTYFQFLEARDRAAVTRQNLAAAQTILRGLKLEARVGTATALDVAQQATTVAVLAASIPPLDEQARQAADALAILLGEQPEALHLAENRMEVHRETAEPWRVTLVDTGEETQTGGRLKRVLSYVKDEPFFALTYGDGVANIDLGAEIAFHKAHGRRATVSVVRPAKRFGAVAIDGDRVIDFEEKPHYDGGWINGGFFLLSPSIGGLIAGDETVWEREPMELLARGNELRAFVHHGFWHPMDSLRDRNFLEAEWMGGRPQWRVW